MAFAWTVAIAAFIAVVVLDAPPMTFAGALAGELLLITLITWRYPNLEERIHRRR